MSIQNRVQQKINVLSQKKRKDMPTFERVQLLQLKLYLKAKQEKNFKFYVLYDKVFQSYILKEAYRKCRKNNGSPGVDHQTFKDVEVYGVDRFLSELSESLRKRLYKPQPVKRVYIEKENGGKRPLGIATIRDRVAQQACKMVLEPIFEADFNGLSYGYRPKRSAQGAIQAIRDNLKQGKATVYDADLSKYFDSIAHDKLEIVLKERIADPRILHLLRLWLKAPIVGEDGKYSGGKRNHSGTPQGGVISPLLANVYMNILDRIVSNPDGYFQRHGVEMIRYADDFILMSRHINRELISRLHSYLHRMGLLINTEKSELVTAKDKPFDFFGFRFSYSRGILYPGNKFWKIEPKPQSRRRIRQQINAKLKGIGHYPAGSVANELNTIIKGWMNYYCIPHVSHTQVALRELQDYMRIRLSRYYHRKSQRKSRLHGQQAFDILVNEYGLIKPYKTSGIRPVNTLR